MKTQTNKEPNFSKSEENTKEIDNSYKIAADKEYKAIKEQINFIIKYGKYFKKIENRK